MRYLCRLVATAAGLGMLTAAAAQPPVPVKQANVVARDLVVEPATLIALGFEWYVEGDDNGNAAVAASYRRKDDQTWHPALPFVRINRIDLSAQYGPPVPLERRPNLLAGSIIDLTPDTDYEVRLVMSDPDGAQGQLEHTVSVRTRVEPMPAAGGRVFHVYPPDHEGPVQQPAFIGLPAAYWNSNNVAADHFNVFPPRVKPGDTILVHAGLYKDDWHYYGTSSAAIPPSGEISKDAACCGATFHGTYFLTTSGTAEKPIVIKGAGDGEAIFDGDGNAEIFNVMGANYIYFEGLTFRNSKVAIQAGRKGIAGAVGLTVKHSHFYDVGDGIHSDWGGSGNFYITDNEFVGRNDPKVLVPWSMGMAAAGKMGERLRAQGIRKEQTQLLSEYAVKVYGSGNVVAFNKVRNFHDGIDHATYGNPDNWPDTPRDRMPVANDFYNNDISNMHDDCFEADGVAYNTRVLHNRCVNAAGSGISTQGTHSGPFYIVGNFVYNVPGNFAALKTSGAEGLRVYNNTFVAATLRSSFGGSDDSDFRNNLILAEFPEEPAYTFSATQRGFPTSDYNGFLAGSEAKGPFVRLAATPPGQKPAETDYPTLKAFTDGTGQDGHSRMITYAVFQKMASPDIVKVTQVYDPNSIDFALARHGAAVDAGVPLPNVTDGYKGKAPDLGALELGAAMPHFGPRN